MAGNLVRKVLVGAPGAELSVSDSRHKDASESPPAEVQRRAGQDLTGNWWILLAKSPEHNLCGKICSRHGAKLDENRTYTLMNSTIIQNIGRVCRLAVISPTVSMRWRQSFGHPRCGAVTRKEVVMTLEGKRIVVLGGSSGI